MSALTFTLKSQPQQRVDLSPLIPDALAGKPQVEIAALLLVTGNRKLRVDQLFDISGSTTTDIIIAGSCQQLDYIGQGMKTGRITVNGDAGSYLGLQQRHRHCHGQ